MQPSWLSAFAEVGLQPSFKQMENGERRYFIKSEDGADYVVTVAGESGGWQNAHYHGGPEALAGRSKEGVHEHYVVEQGWMAVARFFFGLEEGPHLEVFVLQPNQSVSFAPGEHHNVYLPAGAVIHTIKTGHPVGNPNRKMNDWWPDEGLDEASKKLTEEDIMRQKLSYPGEYYSC